jgi:supervillin
MTLRTKGRTYFHSNSVFSPVAKNSNLAVEALAGLASIEDFKSVSLKSSSLPLNQSWLPYKPMMLLHIKGRRHVQTRLVEPTHKSINHGDCFVLVTGDKLFNYVGAYANVIEKSRSKDICAQIIRDKDLGCLATTATVIHEGRSGAQRHVKEFWRLLARPDAEADESIGAGHEDEDELFESCLIETNMIYELKDDTLTPMPEHWGALPSIAMLDAKKVLVFNFGSEVYVWNGKNAPVDDKRVAIKLAQEQFCKSYDYEMCSLCPVNYSLMAGDRPKQKLSKSGPAKPDWCLLAKITQHMETVLFREKFVDWPDITVTFKDEFSLGPSLDIQPLDGASLYSNGCSYTEPNLVLENSNVGRGNFYYDNDTMRHFDVLTKSVTKWKLNDNSYEEMTPATHGHFYTSESYTTRWIYQISVTVRELSGKVSSHRATVGRDRCAYFCWQGIDASVQDKGAAALLTVELDKEKGSQLLIQQGKGRGSIFHLKFAEYPTNFHANC